MTPKKAMLSGAVLLLSTAQLIGCTDGPIQGEEDENKQETSDLLPEEEQIEVEPMVSKDWVGYDVGASPGKWRYVGDMRISDSKEKYIAPVLDDTISSIENKNPGSMIIGDPETKRMYKVDMAERDLQKVARALEKAGLNAPTISGIDSVDDIANVEKGWSNGTDNRTVRGAARYSQGTWPYRTIGQLKRNGSSETANGYCTATFVSSAGDSNTRYIITAAHCLWSADNGSYLDPDFWPRQDSCRTETGGSISGCDQGPYGEWDGGRWMTYTYFVDNCRGRRSISEECVANDIAVMRVHRRSGASFPGALGLAAWGSDDLDSVSKYHRGYPNCAGAGDPVPNPPKVCLPRTLYGDGSFSIDNGRKFEGSWPRIYKFSADTSPGHSGGPGYFSTSGNHYVFGVNSAEDCSGGSCSSSRPNYMRAITINWFNSMMSFMGL